MIPSGLHILAKELADKYIRELSEEQIVSLCPNDYGSTVTDDHRNLIWDLLYNEVVEMEPLEIYDMHKKFVAEKQHMGKALAEFISAAETLKLTHSSTDWLFGRNKRDDSPN